MICKHSFLLWIFHMSLREAKYKTRFLFNKIKEIGKQKDEVLRGKENLKIQSVYRRGRNWQLEEVKGLLLLVGKKQIVLFFFC